MTFLIILFYNLLMLVLLVPILLAILLSGKRNRQDFFYCIKERLSLTKIPEFDRSKKTVWFHCASLGEAKALEPLIPNFKDCNVVITSITKSAREYISKFENVKFYSLAPVDFYPFVSKIVKKIKPDMLILIETEFWPCLISIAHKSGAKIVTVNGRISQNAVGYYKATSLFWKPFLKMIDYISVRNECDYGRFAELLKSEDKIEITGNIKYDRDFAKETLDRKEIGYTEQDLIIVAGSIRGDEGQIVTEVFSELKKKIVNLKLIIAPRHLTKIAELQNLAENAGLSVGLYSHQDKSSKDVLLIDVFGKLQLIYSVADVVFVGGSLIKSGGQNPIEPSAYSKPVVFGQYMYNFESESKVLKEIGGAVEVKDKKELYEVMYKFLTDKQMRDDYGNNAHKAVLMQKGAIEKNITVINKLLN